MSTIPDSIDFDEEVAKNLEATEGEDNLKNEWKLHRDSEKIDQEERINQEICQIKKMKLN